MYRFFSVSHELDVPCTVTYKYRWPMILQYLNNVITNNTTHDQNFFAQMHLQRSKSVLDYATFILIGLASIWLLVVSGLWAKRTHELLGKNTDPLAALTIPPLIEGSIETYHILKATFTYLAVIILPAVPTLVSLIACYKTFSKFSHPILKGVALVLGLGLFIASVILQGHWTVHGLATGSFVLSQHAFNSALRQAAYLLVSFWVLVISGLPAIIIVTLGVYVYKRLSKKAKVRLE